MKRRFAFTAACVIGLGCQACDTRIPLGEPRIPSPGELVRTRVTDGEFANISEPLVGIGRLSQGQSIDVTVRSAASLSLFLVDSDGRVVDGVDFVPPAGFLRPERVWKQAFAIDVEDEYFLFVYSNDAHVGSVELRFIVGNAADVEPRPAQYVVLQFDGAEKVELSGGMTILDVPEMDLSVFGPVSSRGFLAELRPLVEELIASRLSAIFGKYGVRIVTSTSMVVGSDYSSVYFTSCRGPADDDPFESVTGAQTSVPTVECRPLDSGNAAMGRKSSACPNCILYGDSGRIDLGNRNHSDDAVVYLGSFTEARIDTSVSDMAHLLANVAAHEIGHLLGLVHVLHVSDLMRGRFSLGLIRDLDFSSGQIVLNADIVPFLFQDPERYLRRISAAEP